MSWATENKFIAGFGTVMVIGLGCLGYLTNSASNALDAAQGTYGGNSNSLSNLHNLVPYPKLANQKKVEAERDKVIAAYQSLQKDLAATKFPSVELSAAEFQSELKRTVDAVIEKANTAGIPLNREGQVGDQKANESAKLDLGFDYLGQLPEGSAASPLGRQLKVIDWVVNMMIDKKVAGLPEIKREKLPEEMGVQPPKPAEKGKKKAKGEASDPETGLIERSTFTVRFRAPQSVVTSVLNAIAGCKEQFLVIRKVSIANTSPQPPAKAQQAGSPGGAPPAEVPAAAESPAPQATPAAPPQPIATPADSNNNRKLTFILGEEMVDVEADIEILDFAEPAEAIKTAKKP